MKRSALVLMPTLLVLMALGCSPGPAGVWVRVAEAGCDVVVELMTEDGARSICPVVVDLVRLLAELRAAEAGKRAAVIRYVDPDLGDPVLIVVPAPHVATAIGSVRAAMARGGR